MNLQLILFDLLLSQFYSPPQTPLSEPVYRLPPTTDGFMPAESWLFPDNYTYTSAWTSSSWVDNPNISNVDISLEDLGALRVDTRRPPCEVVPAPNISCPSPQKAWKAFYPEGSINPRGAIPGGLGFYLTGPGDFQEKLRTAREAIFGYSVLFQEDWEWVKGGKLPGACMFPLPWAHNIDSILFQMAV